MNRTPDDLELFDSCLLYLQHLSNLGIEYMSRPVDQGGASDLDRPSGLAPAIQAAEAGSKPAGSPRDPLLEELARLGGVPPDDSLDRVAEEIAACKACRLHRERKNPVPGEGDPSARLVFIGEGPGATEDATGRPFVGPAGRLLTRIIQAIELDRSQVFITNIVKCRPPGNREPTPEEAAACRPFLLRQIRLIRPAIIVALGRVAAQNLLDSKKALGRLRGRFHDWHGIRLMPTYHPSFLLQQPAFKRPVWEDMKKVRDAYRAIARE